MLERLAREPELGGWKGLGLAVQAYQKRAPRGDRGAGRRSRARTRPPADGAPGQGRLLGQRDQARPGRGPARLSGLHHQGRHRPLLSRLRRGADRRAGAIYPRNSPPTTPTRSRPCARWPKARRKLEYQRLHGMGEALYAAAEPPAPVRVYAPVGGHEELLPYLVRRLLENGANTSFVHAFLDERCLTRCGRRRSDDDAGSQSSSPPPLAPPSQLYGASRRNSTGRDISIQSERDALVKAAQARKRCAHAFSACAQSRH